jgi:hypothetical protein
MSAIAWSGFDYVLGRGGEQSSYSFGLGPVSDNLKCAVGSN